MTEVRVRIAPSPTGNLHIGTTRTTLFNYLFAQHHQGKMVLRIEDTDTQRSEERYTANILSGLKGLGLDWQEGPEVGGDYGPYYQSERLESYRVALDTLLDKGLAYPCFASPEELQAEREAAEKEGKTYVYSGLWRDASAEKIQERLDAGEQPVYRLKVPSKEVLIQDLVRGEVKVHTNTIGDFIIAKAGKQAIYNFAVVVDDLAMKISHVLRGEDHISNTPKQILIYEALGEKVPAFGHTAMMLAPDRSKLSKRHGATSVDDYLAQGYLPEALVNYLALLGWSAPEGREILTLQELIELFDLKDVNKSGAVFDVEKLKWVNAQWIKRLSVSELAERLSAFDPVLAKYSAESLEPMVALVQEKLTLLSDFSAQVDFLLVDALEYLPENTEKAFAMPSAHDVLTLFYAKIQAVESWELTSIADAFSELKSELDYKMKQIMWPIRAALSGRTFGADLQKSILLLGQERTLKRLQKAQEQVKV